MGKTRLNAPAIFGVISLMLLVVGCSPASADEQGPTVGVILDYTGTEAAGFSDEQALLLAADLMADARPGAAPFRFVYRDARGNPEHARRAALQLVEEGVDVVIGPSTDQVVPMVREALDEAGIVLVSPNPTISDDATDEHPWFRLSPGNFTGSTSPALIGEHMAREFASRGAERALIISDNDVYNVELVRGFKAGLANHGGRVAKQLTANGSKASQTIAALKHDQADTVVVALSILHAAQLIWNVSSSTQEPVRWLLTPRLKSPLLLANTPTGALERAFGVSLRIPQRASGCNDALAQECFSEVMRGAWGADAFESAYFMYDAAALALIALDKVWRENDGVIEHAALSEAIFATAERGGVRVGWNDFATAVEASRAGDDVQYAGATGSIVFTRSGSRVGGDTVVFEVNNHAFTETSH